MIERGPRRRVLLALLGPATWAVHFFTLYFVASLPAYSATPSSIRVWGIGLTLFAVSALFALQLAQGLRPPSGEASGFSWCVGTALTILSALAVAWTALPIALS